MVNGVQLKQGAEVLSGDGKRLGSVREVGNDRFKLARRLLPDYWLAVEYVAQVSEDVVYMVLPKEGIGAARVRAPLG